MGLGIPDKAFGGGNDPRVVTFSLLCKYLNQNFAPFSVEGSTAAALIYYLHSDLAAKKHSK